MAAANRKASSNVAAAGGTFTWDIDVEGMDEITVIGDLGPTATAAGDITVAIQPYLSDYMDGAQQSGSGTNDGYQNDPALADAGLDLVQTTIYPGVSAYLSGGHARVMVRVDLKGFGKVRLVLTNHNATTALPARLDFFGE